ncbi:MAG: alpha/beta fold hydrolase [Acidobacteria bacterium]|nr:alpha/beta fold hydrolase [Acidobacteriota bacterium]
MDNRSAPCFLVICLSFLIFTSCRATPKETLDQRWEEFGFTAGRFALAGELRLPTGEGPHPLVIMVHGDGPASRRYFFSLKKCFLEAGYATLMWDKPGCGESTGSFSREHLRAERAAILLAAIEKCKRDPRLDARLMGVWGISQAGYVIPMALPQTEDIAFMILVGVAGENGIRQTAYFVSRQILCEGYSAEQAEEARKLAAGVCGALSYEEYVRYGEVLLARYPIVRDLDFMAGILPAERWQAQEPDSEAYVDPIRVMELTTIPVRVFLGEKDRNVDPRQAVEAYEQAFRSAQNPDFAVRLIPGTDHNIILCETGCEKERRNRSREEWSRYAPEYLQAMKDWLLQLRGVAAPPAGAHQESFD